MDFKICPIVVEDVNASEDLHKAEYKNLIVFLKFLKKTVDDERSKSISNLLKEFSVDKSESDEESETVQLKTK